MKTVNRKMTSSTTSVGMLMLTGPSMSVLRLSEKDNQTEDERDNRVCFDQSDADEHPRGQETTRFRLPRKAGNQLSGHQTVADTGADGASADHQAGADVRAR
jgi:hypothetical protein